MSKEYVQLPNGKIKKKKIYYDLTFDANKFIKHKGKMLRVVFKPLHPFAKMKKGTVWSEEK